MLKKIIIKFIQGIAYGCTVLTVLGLIFAINDGSNFNSLTSHEYIRNVIASMISGVGFVVPSIIYERKNLSMGMQIFIHMGVGLTVYILSALYGGWIPVDYGLRAIVLSIIIMIMMSFIIWSGFYIYFKREAKIMNMKIQDLEK